MSPPAGKWVSPHSSNPADETSLDEAVRAVGHPGRRAMLRLARDGEQTAADLAQAAGLSASAASQHLKVLRDTGLLDVRADAQRRLYRVNADRLAQVRALLDELWSDRLSALTPPGGGGRTGRSTDRRTHGTDGLTPDPSHSRDHQVTLVDQRVSIAASPARVYALLTDATRFVTWMAPEATIEARPGGTITWRHENGDRCGGSFLELVPDRRIVFTYGWEREDVAIPVGSTTVEITLHPTTGGTELHLVHRGLSAPMSQAHAGGWRNYLRRLIDVAEHRDPGPDALAGQRIPAARERHS